MQLTLLGTASASGIPRYGCHCRACTQAQANPSLRREETSAVVDLNNHRLLIDANASHFAQRFPSGSYDAILLTHFHMDHVKALFDLRWGDGAKIEVITPPDSKGADDLFKHSGILVFTAKAPFVPFQWQGVTITPIPLNHSRPTHGYVFEVGGKRLAYLTDTAWMSEQSLAWLDQHPLDYLLLDTAHPPANDGQAPRNHHDIAQAKRLFQRLQPQSMGLIHLSDAVLNWAEANPDFFNEKFYLAEDGQTFILD